MVILDTSFLVALARKSDVFHEEAEATDLAGQRLLIPWDAWVETCQILSWVAPPEQLPTLLQNLRDRYEIGNYLQEDEVAEATVQLQRLNERLVATGFKILSLVDVLLLRLAARLRESLVTFDDGMKAAIRAKQFPGARIH